MERFLNKKIKKLSIDKDVNDMMLDGNNDFDKYGDEYKNEEGKVTPYHLLFNNYGDDILEMDKDDAINFCIKKIKEINGSDVDEESFEKMEEEEIDNFNRIIRDSNDSLDIIFTLKDIMLNDKIITHTSKRLKKRL